jgi:hypothetical protein
MEDFVLPLIWYIELDDDNRKIVNDWKMELGNYPGDCFDKNYDMIDNEGGGGFFMNGKDGWGDKITTEQFIKYVLKQEVEESVEDYNYLIKILKQL